MSKGVVTIEEITPEMATEILKSNNMNRAIKSDGVTRYAADMKAGKWELNGSCIVIADTGELLDGQNRLWAVKFSNTSILTLVLRGVSKDVFRTIDMGIGRSAQDILHIYGIEKGTKIVAAARAIIAYKADARISTQLIGRSVATDFVIQNEYLPELFKTVSKAHGIVTVAPLLAVLFIAGETGTHRVKVDEFLENLKSKNGWNEGHAVKRLYTWAESQRRDKKNQLKFEETFVSVARCWNAFATDKPISLHTYNNIPFQSVEIVGSARRKRLHLEIPQFDARTHISAG